MQAPRYRAEMTVNSDPQRPTEDGVTHFGFRDVPAAEKASLVRGVFDSVASRYDLMNDLMSAGVHRLWKTTLIAAVAPRAGEILLDVAGGTGDIAFRFLDAAASGAAGRPDAPEATRTTDATRAVICDINAAMLGVGRDRALDQGRLKGIDWANGDAENLPIASASVDVYTIAFGLRNVTRIDRALQEARRVLKPGGRFFCLEFSHVTAPLLNRLYDLYSFNVLPLIGRVVAGDRESYQYLVESIRKFPRQEELLARMEQAGLERGRCRNLSGGIAAIHSAWRI